MTERCIICHFEFVEREDSERFALLCANCMQMAELKATHHGLKPSIANPTDVMVTLEQAFKKIFGAA